MLHLYFHIPFCRQRCAYCDFVTYAGMENHLDAYVAALCTELTMLAVEHAACLALESHPSQIAKNTIFFGGGTPSILSLQQIERILAAAAEFIALEEAEISLEVNPGTLLGGTKALDYFQGLKALGVNRLSLGIQSLDDSLLKLLGRIHTVAEAKACFAAAHQAGFTNVNGDFLFGLPGQQIASWAQTLETLVLWGFEHLSLYSLTLEAETPLAQRIEQGVLALPSEDETATMYEMALAYLAAAGYENYEISNWAKKNASQNNENLLLACNHNLAYWLNQNYLGLGAGAHGQIFPKRYSNQVKITEYLANLQAGQRPVAEEIEIKASERFGETVFLGLRLTKGLTFAHFYERCGVDMRTIYGIMIGQLETKGLLEITPTAVRLTPRGRMLGNQVFAQFV